MKLIDSLATQYWIDNTKQIYEENYHVSTPVMDAYRAGFEEAKRLIADYELKLFPESSWVEIPTKELLQLGEEDVNP